MESSIDFFIEDIDYQLDFKDELSQWIIYSISKELKTPGNLAIILCSDHYLHQINLQYLNHDTYTDIVTFDYSESTLISGDLFISIDRIKENAKLHSVNEKDELHRVIIHGVLHLIGYKDKQPDDKKQMTLKEDFYLSLRQF